MRKGKLHIQEDVFGFVEATLQEIQDVRQPEVQVLCPCCGYGVRFPLIVRQHNLEDFQLLMTSACIAMDEMGITNHLLAKIRANCFIEIARRKANATNQTSNDPGPADTSAAT